MRTNLETHGTIGLLTTTRSGITPTLIVRCGLLSATKNHASVIFWSLGNESGSGPNHAANGRLDYTNTIRHASSTMRGRRALPIDPDYVDMRSRMYFHARRTG